MSVTYVKNIPVSFRKCCRTKSLIICVSLLKPVGKILNMLHVVIGHSAFILFSIIKNIIKTNLKAIQNAISQKAFNTVTKANVFMAEFYSTDRIVSILKHDFVVQKKIHAFNNLIGNHVSEMIL